MAALVVLEGSEEDFAKLLVFHRIITEVQLQKALEERQSHAARGGSVESLRQTLLRTKIVPTGLILDTLHAASKVVGGCTKCGAVHHIHHYHPHSRYFCTSCKGLLRVTDPGQSMKWSPGELVASVLELTSSGGLVAPAPKPGPVPPARLPEKTVGGSSVRNPLDDPSAAADAVAPRGTTSPPSAAPSGPVDRSVTLLPGSDETMLDLGVLPKGAPKIAGSGPAQPPPAPPKPRLAGEGLPSWMDQDDSMLDLGVARPGPAAALPPKSREERRGPPAPDVSVTSIPGGGETMLDLGSSATGRPAASARPGTPASAPKVDPARSTGPAAGAGEPLLDRGPVRGGGASGPADAGATTSLIPGARPRGGKSHSAGGAAPASVPSATEVTAVRGSNAATVSGAAATASGSQSADKTQLQSTPKTYGGGTSGGVPGAKSLPAEVAASAKDPSHAFGKYVLMNELGRGGAGVVYRAWDTLLLQYVALKFIRNQDEGDHDSTSGTSQIEEFQREARMSVRLRHPNIVRIYELGCMSNRYYLSMEYIEGGTLLSLIHGGKDRNQKTRFHSDPVKFLKIIRDVSLAVDYAHNSKPPVIHRDLKPHNVLVDTKGNPYVVDFGLAKEVDTGEGATLTGVVKGTPTYMAPEQAEGRNRDVDARTDVYSLGSILYEMLTGRPPFVGESVPEILRKIATELPDRPNDVIQYAPKDPDPAGTTRNSKTATKPLLVPKPLETICLKAIEKGKNDRYSTAKEFAEDIDRYLRDEDILAQEPGLWRRIRRKVRQRPILTGAVGAILLATLTTSIAFRAGRAPQDDGSSRRALIEGIVARGGEALRTGDWVKVAAAAEDLQRQEATHPKIAELRKALKEREVLVEKTRREWSAELDRIRREPLSQVLPGLREKFRHVPELQPAFREGLNSELVALKGRMLDEARRLVGTGARPAWVEDIIKSSARQAKDQLETLLGLAKDPDFPYPVEESVREARDGLDRLIAYQGTWSLRVNVVPFAEVTVRQAGQELADDFTPLGLRELEVLGSSYVVELAWPSRANPKVKRREEIREVHHGQTVLIRGDLTQDDLRQERR